jgi:hypothetical protein
MPARLLRIAHFAAIQQAMGVWALSELKFSAAVARG